MATFSEWPEGQSNAIRRQSPSYGQSMIAYVLPMMKAIVDPTEAEATLTRQWENIGGLPLFTGTGCAFDNTPAAIGGDNYAGAASTWEAFVRPAAPLDTARFLDWATWPLSDRGNDVVNYATGLSAGIKAQQSYIFCQHSEYDSQGWLNSWSMRDYRILEFAHRRFIGAVRAALGKTAATLPALYSVPIPFGSGSNEGFNLCMRAFEALVADRSFNARFAVRQTMDCDWDSDLPGTYTSHGTDADIALLARRSALGIANAMGPTWSPTNNKLSAWRGPRIVHVQWINSTTLDVSIEHDGGSDLTLPATPAAGWRVEYGGATVAISSVTKTNKRTLRIALAGACAKPQAIRVFYNWGNSRTFPGGAFYDDQATWDAKALPAAIAGADRIAGALNRTGWQGVVATASAPPARILAPLAA